ncbi:hypothetical protein AB1286_04180 [Trinickia sp. NRRL B-1857]|uniref:hypothetical protein n=1 Tax=Trinickia sp. NRRL B-1857 TaxID=3162879 RepID=UPI003D264E33
MSDTLRKAALIEAWGATLHWMRRCMQSVRSPRPWRMQWTPRVAALAVVGALFFAWAFLRIVLIVVFPYSPPR